MPDDAVVDAPEEPAAGDRVQVEQKRRWVTKGKGAKGKPARNSPRTGGRVKEILERIGDAAYVGVIETIKNVEPGDERSPVFTRNHDIVPVSVLHEIGLDDFKAQVAQEHGGHGSFAIRFLAGSNFCQRLRDPETGDPLPDVPFLVGKIKEGVPDDGKAEPEASAVVPEDNPYGEALRDYQAAKLESMTRKLRPAPDGGVGPMLGVFGEMMREQSKQHAETIKLLSAQQAENQKLIVQLLLQKNSKDSGDSPNPAMGGLLQAASGTFTFMGKVMEKSFDLLDRMAPGQESDYDSWPKVIGKAVDTIGGTLAGRIGAGAAAGHSPVPHQNVPGPRPALPSADMLRQKKLQRIVTVLAAEARSRPDPETFVDRMLGPSFLMLPAADREALLQFIVPISAGDTGKVNALLDWLRGQGLQGLEHLKMAIGSDKEAGEWLLEVLAMLGQSLEEAAPVRGTPEVQPVDDANERKPRPTPQPVPGEAFDPLRGGPGMQPLDERHRGGSTVVPKDAEIVPDKDAYDPLRGGPGLKPVVDAEFSEEDEP